MKKIKPANLSVGDVARRSGVSISTLHFYEEKGLIHAVRTAGNQRRYNTDVLRRIGVIKAAQRVGISLENIKQAMAFLPTNRAPNKRDWQRLSSQWDHELTHRINQLVALRDNLTNCIGCGCLSLKACPLYNPDDELGLGHSGAVLLDRKAAAKLTNEGD
ncbi:redox-sensitive transcriptional activator SoxR [Marinicella sediminis]|uniref:Redox-sensitive transcriptional activator SoxR n=1 Tax=Marinicella sediminis TaxID=1792834 RepID=A0ABV7JJK2_9GAMM|nr:redox-sensitive transcriptional activator SoxR [Marinicella sediminis]